MCGRQPIRPADVFVQVEPGRDFEVLWTLRGLLRGHVPEPGSVLGAPLDVLRDLRDA